MGKTGYILFHQGWTDIMNCLALVSYYSEQYEKIVLLIKNDAKPFVEFYTKEIGNLELMFLDEQYIFTSLNIYNHIPRNENNIILFHGMFDNQREDEFKNAWRLKEHSFFLESFYNFYNLDYSIRTKYFNIKRNIELENEIYNKFVEAYGENYILYHDNFESNTLVDIIPKKDGISIINLNRISETFFDFIKVIIHAKELHFMDSVWGALAYHLDVKYSLLQDKEVHLYSKRSYGRMFTEPNFLTNWKIIT